MHQQQQESKVKDMTHVSSSVSSMSHVRTSISRTFSLLAAPPLVLVWECEVSLMDSTIQDEDRNRGA